MQNMWDNVISGVDENVPVHVKQVHNHGNATYVMYLWQYSTMDVVYTCRANNTLALGHTT